MKVNRIFLIGMILSLSLVATFALAQMAPRMHSDGNSMGPCRMNSVPDDVKLSYSQRAQILKIQNTYTPRLSEINALIRDLNVAISNEKSKQSPNQTKLDSLIKQRDQAFSNLNDIHSRINKEVSSILTEKQKSYFGEEFFGSCRLMSSNGGQSYSSVGSNFGGMGYHSDAMGCFGTCEWR